MTFPQGIQTFKPLCYWIPTVGRANILQSNWPGFSVLIYHKMRHGLKQTNNCFSISNLHSRAMNTMWRKQKQTHNEKLKIKRIHLVAQKCHMVYIIHKFWTIAGRILPRLLCLDRISYNSIVLNLLPTSASLLRLFWILVCTLFYAIERWTTVAN